MALDDDADDDAAGMGPPLPPEDRLWRHPSELREHGTAGGPVPAPLPTMRSRPVPWAVALVAGLAGAAVTVGVIALTGSLSPRVIERAVVEKVAVTPVVSSPMLRGERGVDAVAQRLGPAIVRLDVQTAAGGAATGSGVLFRDDGLVLTSARVVADSAVISVVLIDGRRLVGRVVGVDTATDVAVVDVDGLAFPVAVLGSSNDLQVGASTIAIGAPATVDGSPSVATGVISAVSRRFDAPDGAALHGMIQTDAPIAEGTSGGPLVDATGAVIGITTATAEGADAGFGFATPIDLARRVAEQLLRTGHMVHGWLGVEGADLPADEADRLGVDGGALITSVAGGSPAEAAGLAAHDVITEIDGAHVDSVSALVVDLRDHEPGDSVVIGYWHGGQHAVVTVTLAPH